MNDSGFTAALAALCLILGMLVGARLVGASMRNEAVKAGAAHYVHSPDKPEGVFTWGPAK